MKIVITDTISAPSQAYHRCFVKELSIRERYYLSQLQLPKRFEGYKDAYSEIAFTLIDLDEEYRFQDAQTVDADLDDCRSLSRDYCRGLACLWTDAWPPIRKFR